MIDYAVFCLLAAVCLWAAAQGSIARCARRMWLKQRNGR